MYIVIAGGGIVGSSIAAQLSREHSVVVIDSDRELCEKIYSTYGIISICGDTSKIETLRDAGMEKCDIAIAAMRNDATNLVFALLARDLGAREVFARMSNPEYEHAYKVAGATNIVSGIDMLVDKFVMDIKQPDIRRLASLGEGRAEISIVAVPIGAACSGKTVQEIALDSSFPKDCVIAGIYDVEGDKLVIPRGEARIYSSNQVFLVAPRDSMVKAAKYIRK